MGLRKSYSKSMRSAYGRLEGRVQGQGDSGWEKEAGRRWAWELGTPAPLLLMGRQSASAALGGEMIKSGFDMFVLDGSEIFLQTLRNTG